MPTCVNDTSISMNISVAASILYIHTHAFASWLLFSSSFITVYARASKGARMLSCILWRALQTYHPNENATIMENSSGRTIFRCGVHFFSSTGYTIDGRENAIFNFFFFNFRVI